MENNPPSYNKAGAQGSLTVSIHTERKVKVYAVHEPELDSLSYLNAATTALCGFGSFFASQFFSNIKTATETYLWYLDSTGITAGVLFGLAIIAFFLRRGMISRIKRESVSR